VANAELPLPLRHLRAPDAGPRFAFAAPEIAFPPDGARIDLGFAAGSAAAAPLALKVRNGTPPFTWLIDGQPVDPGSWERSASWTPAGPGFVSVTVVDAKGSASRARVFLD